MERHSTATTPQNIMNRHRNQIALFTFLLLGSCLLGLAFTSRNKKTSERIAPDAVYVSKTYTVPAASVVSVSQLEDQIIRALKAKTGAKYLDWEDGYYKGTTQSYVVLPNQQKYQLYFCKIEGEGMLLSITTPTGSRFQDEGLKGSLSMASADFVKLEDMDWARAEFEKNKADWNIKFREVLNTLASEMTPKP